MNDIAIYFSKLDLCDGTHVFKPISVIRGIYDEEDDQFQTNYGVLCESINGNDYYSIDFFGCQTNIDELRKSFGKNASEQVLLDEYFSLCTEYLYVGYYDYANYKIITKKISFDLIESESEEISEKEYSEEKPMGTFNFDLDSLKNIRDSKSLKEVREKINNIISLLDDTSEEDKSLKKESPTNFEFEFNITPYTILGLDEGEYTNEEVLIAAKKMLKHINSLGIDKQAAKGEIDCILDAYNEIVTPLQKKRNFYKKKF